MKIYQAYKYAFDVTPREEQRLRSHAGASRFAYNWGLAKCGERYAAEWKWYSAAELHKLWNAEKKASPALAWWSENSKCAYQEAFRDLERGLRNFTASKKGLRKGPRVRYPKRKKKGRSRDSFRLSGRGIRCAGNMVTLPRLGTLRAHESTEKLASKVSNGSARILSATVSRTAQRWFVSFAVEVERAQPVHARAGSAVGVDLGVKTLLTAVDDAWRVLEVAGCSPLRASLRKLRRASRAHSHKTRGSANRRKSAARLARLHARVANVRADSLHKATTGLARRYETIVVEDLNVTGMISNQRLSRAVLDQGFGAARRMLGYKTAREGGRLIVADRWYPSSKLCSSCGMRKPSLTLKERMFTCELCGHVEDRDVNAARNLLNLAVSGTESLNACGALARPRLTPGRGAVKQEPGASPEDKTGTAPAQAGAVVER